MNNWTRFVQGCAPRRTCLLCGGDTRDPVHLCPGCRDDLPFIDHACPRCAVPLPSPLVCPACQRRPPAFERGWAAFRYEPPLRALVHGLKFRRDLVAAHGLGLLLAEQVLTAHLATPDALVPVPLHRVRLRERGYNQALELARPVARRLGLPVLTGALVRRRATRPQTEITSPAGRRRNVRAAFDAGGGLQGLRHVVVFDDVMTTGATLGEASKALRRAGIERVDVWVLARATG